VATLSTAYILIDGGHVTSVEAVSQTRPLPADNPELAAAHTRAARLIGMQAVYLDAGSGAGRPVPPAVIAACRAVLGDATVPVFVGGGIRTPDAVAAARSAGADFVVVGNAQEGGGDAAGTLASFVQAARGART
jgi:putative glycerol-1-phosphate prenyltransferase